MHRLFAGAALVACLLSQPYAQSAGTGRLNDTGLTQCRVNGGFTESCEGTGQDAEYGRDVASRRPGDGRAGFDWVKVGATGEALPASADQWSCVHDRVTGLTWEMKTDDGGLHDKDTSAFPWAPVLISAFIQQVNAERLCGYGDWRLPTRAELLGLVDFTKLPGEGIDPGWFPHSGQRKVWTSSCVTCDVYMWAFAPHASAFRGEYFDTVWFEEYQSVRLVRDGGQIPPQPRFNVQGAEAMDHSAGLVWRRCNEGQGFDGERCTGNGMRFASWEDALARANAQAQRTGQKWRLPNLKEMDSLLNFSGNDVRVDDQAFAGLSGQSFWTSTAYGQRRDRAWCVDILAGSLAISGLGDSRCRPRSAVLLVRDR